MKFPWSIYIFSAFFRRDCSIHSVSSHVESVKDALLHAQTLCSCICICCTKHDMFLLVEWTQVTLSLNITDSWFPKVLVVFKSKPPLNSRAFPWCFPLVFGPEVRLAPRHWAGQRAPSPTGGAYGGAAGRDATIGSRRRGVGRNGPRWAETGVVVGVISRCLVDQYGLSKLIFIKHAMGYKIIWLTNMFSADNVWSALLGRAGERSRRERKRREGKRKRKKKKKKKKARRRQSCRCLLSQPLGLVPCMYVLWLVSVQDCSRSYQHYRFSTLGRRKECQ